MSSDSLKWVVKTLHRIPWAREVIYIWLKHLSNQHTWEIWLKWEQGESNGIIYHTLMCFIIKSDNSIHQVQLTDHNTERTLLTISLSPNSLWSWNIRWSIRDHSYGGLNKFSHFPPPYASCISFRASLAQMDWCLIWWQSLAYGYFFFPVKHHDHESILEFSIIASLLWQHAEWLLVVRINLKGFHCWNSNHIMLTSYSFSQKASFI